MLVLVMIAMTGAADLEPPQIDAGHDELRKYLQEAVQNHPGIEARFEEWQAALERIPQVKSLDDPSFTFGFFVQSTANRARFMLSQKFPWFGTLKTRGNEAAAQAEAALSRFYQERDAVLSAVKEAYFEYAFLAGSIDVTDAQLQILAFIHDVVESKYSLGLATEDELIRVGIEQIQVQDRLDQLRQLRPALSAALDTSIGRRPGPLLPWPDTLELPGETPSRKAVHTQIRANNPAIQEFDHHIHRFQEQKKLARKKGKPDFTLGVDYVTISQPRKINPDRPFPAGLAGAQRLLTGGSAGPVGALIDAYALATIRTPVSRRSSGEDNVQVFATVNLPIWRKRIRSGINEARHREQASELMQERTIQSLEAMADQVLFDLEDGLRRITVFEDSLIPQAERSYDSSQSAYSAGVAQVDFLDLLESVRQLLDFQLEHLRAERDVHIANAELERLTGGSLQPTAESR